MRTLPVIFAQQYDWDITLSDISVQTLALGARQAQMNGLDPDQARRVAIDFHDLPFPDGAFDIVYIASALHHTRRWQMVLKELQRVTAPNGLLILQNEPCRRFFCFYKFPTNRPEKYRPIEVELKQQGIIKTIAEPFPGSCPETLFGMIENQKMPLPEILQILSSEAHRKPQHRFERLYVRVRQYYPCSATQYREHVEHGKERTLGSVRQSAKFFNSD